MFILKALGLQLINQCYPPGGDTDSHVTTITKYESNGSYCWFHKCGCYQHYGSLECQRLDPSFDPRSGLSEEDAQVFRDMARDLPPQFTSGSPFTSALAEGFTPEDTHDLMEALTSVLIQIWILVLRP